MYVSLIGRSNVGKSSLFNSILAQAGKASNILKSIVSEKPGTTRNSKQAQFYLKGNKITLVDTGGFEAFLTKTPKREDSSIFKIIEKETHKAVESSNLIFFVLDGNEGVTQLDIHLAEKLKNWVDQAHIKPEVKLVINKLENKGSEEYYEALSDCLSDCYTLYMGEPLFVSAQERTGIEKLTGIMEKMLPNKETRKLEEMAIMPKIDNEEAENLEVSEETEDLHDHYEIEKSLRVCNTVKGNYKPSERWLKLLNNVCGIPFISKEEDGFVVPSIHSPSEMLANLYLSDNHKTQPQTPSAEFLKLTLNNSFETNSNENIDELNNPNCKLVNNSEQTEDSNLENKTKPKTKVMENVINPINLLVLGSVDSNRHKLLSMLCENYGETEFSDTSPNWHSFYSNWPTKVKEQEIIQPVEIVVPSPLNLGGSIGKSAVLQTLSLLRKCDFVLFCINNEEESRKSQDGTKKLTLSKREVSWLSRAVRFNKPIAIAALVGNSYQNCKLFLTKDYPLSFEFQNIPIVSVHPSGNLGEKSIKKLKSDITSLLNRSKKMIETSTLNSWLRTFIAKWPPPWKDGSKLNLKFAAQVRSSPPTFVLWSNVFATFPQHYLRQLKLALSEEFGFLGVPLKFVLRTTFKSKPNSNKLTGIKLKRQLFN
uniref:ORF1-related protein, putative n=1 Tax=Theileria annulata TaxID=5874 RepID=A0A3B0MUM8_THEAN